MSSTSQLTTFSDLYTDLNNRMRGQTGVTATDTIAKRLINIALHDMHLGFSERMPWAERRAVLRTQPQYTTGTVAITKGSTTLTGTDTLWNTNNDFAVANARTTGKLVIGGSEEVYTISAVTNDTSITLNERFIDDTVTEASYVYFEDEYALATDFLRPVDAQTFTENRDIDLIGRSEFRRRYPRNNVPGKPTVATIVDRGFSGSTTPVRRVLLHRPPDAAYLLPYNYITSLLAVSSAGAGQTDLSADSDEPIVPLRYRHAIVYHAMAAWYRDRKDDQRAAEALASYTDIMVRISSDTEVGASRPQFQPRISPYTSRARKPWRGGTGRYTVGSRFDEIR